MPTESKKFKGIDKKLLKKWKELLIQRMLLDAVEIKFLKIH